MEGVGQEAAALHVAEGLIDRLRPLEHRDGLAESRFQGRIAGHDLEPGFGAQERLRVAVEVDHDIVVSAHDEQGRNVHPGSLRRGETERVDGDQHEGRLE